MKRMIRIAIAYTFMIAMITATAYAQKIDAQRMDRDIKVAENVLSTLIRQKFDSRDMFFPLEVRGSYQEGYGATFTLPPDYTTPIIFTAPGNDMELIFEDAQGVSSRQFGVPAPRQPQMNRGQDWSLKDRKQRNLDSLRDVSNDRLVEAVQEFLADYSDIISQVQPDERIVVTNGGTQPKAWIGNIVNAPSRSHLSVEVAKADLNQFKQNKINRDQLIKKIKVTNAAVVDEVQPDLELLSTIFTRLYRADLSKTYFTEGNIYFERLKDFGAVFYMQMFSAARNFNGMFDMPTLGLENLSKEDRDKKAKEIYPAFEKELKENVIEYGRTLKSLGDNENLVFNVRVTRCENCQIPETLEVSVKGSVLKDYNAGKIDKHAALSKVIIKKGAEQ